MTEKRMVAQNEKIYDFGETQTSSEALADVYFNLKRLAALCAGTAENAADMTAALQKASALTVRVKSGLDAYLQQAEGRSLDDFASGTPAGNVAAVVSVACDAAFVVGNADEAELRNRLRVLAVETDKLPLLTAQMESETSMRKAKEQG